MTTTTPNGATTMTTTCTTPSGETTTTDPTALTIDGAAATLAALPDSPDVRTAAAMLAAAPTTASGTLRKWMTAHDGETVDTLQFRTWCGHDTLAAWAPTDRTIDASRAGSVRFNGSTLEYRGVRVIGADDVSIVTLSDEFLTVYRLSSARPAPGAAEGDATTPARVPPTVTARLCIHCDEPVPAPTSASGMARCGHCGTLMSPDRLYDDGERIDAFELHPYFACDNCDGGGPACGEVSHRGTDASGAVWQRCDDCGPPTEDAAPTAPTDPRPTTTVMNDQGVTFHARLIRTGDRYGLVDKLTNDGAAMVEFFDAEADPVKFGPLGQFVSRYYVDTFNETAEDGRGIALDGGVPRWTISAANVAEVAAWLASLDTPAPLGAIVAPDKLNAVMEFDHVVTVNEDGTVSDGPAGVYAPDLLDHEVSDPTRWAPFGNYTSQQGGGWLMHNCESIGGQMARDILAEPGTYVAVVAYWSPDENDDHADEEGAILEGWAVFRLIEPAPIGAVEIDPTEAVCQDELRRLTAPDRDPGYFLTYEDEEGDSNWLVGPFATFDEREEWANAHPAEAMPVTMYGPTRMTPAPPADFLAEMAEIAASDADWQAL